MENETRGRLSQSIRSVGGAGPARQQINVRTRPEHEFSMGGFTVSKEPSGPFAGKYVLACEATSQRNGQAWRFELIYSPRYMMERNLAYRQLTDDARAQVRSCLSRPWGLREWAREENRIRIKCYTDEEKQWAVEGRVV